MNNTRLHMLKWTHSGLVRNYEFRLKHTCMDTATHLSGFSDSTDVRVEVRGLWVELQQ